MGAWVGSQAHKEIYVSEKVAKWVKDVEELARLAKDEPQAVYACYTKAVSHRWTYIQRTIPGISSLFGPLEEAIKEKLIPAIIGRHVNELEREIFSLPVRMGGLNLRNPMETADAEFKTSAFVTEGLAQVIKDQDMDFRNFDEEESIRRIKSEKVRKENELKEKYDNLMERMTDLKGRKMVELATEKGAGHG